MNKSSGVGVTGILGFFAIIALAIGVVALPSFKGDIRSRASQVLSTNTSTMTIVNGSDIANQDGDSVQAGSETIWIGNGQSTSSSYLGMRFSGDNIPKGATINSAKVEFTQKSDQWISIKFSAFAENSANTQVFSSSNKLSSRSLTSANSAYADNVKWETGENYSYDVTAPVTELIKQNSTNVVTLIFKGTGGQWGRKFDIYANPSTGKSPRLVITYTSEATGATTSSTATAMATTLATVRPTATARATIRPTATAATTTPAGGGVSQATPITGGTGGSATTIFGAVSADILGTCSATIHDKYVTTGPDGKLYRTWHPAKDPSGCTFAHEHGDNPATSKIYSGNPVPFGYIAAQLSPPMDEPHVGFKCFVANEGQVNDEGASMLHNSYFCFHMGTGGAARFNARFHSLDYHTVTKSGSKMNLQGLADTGNVGTICDSPRQQRTVQGFGCMLDSAYEIWENKLSINNKGNNVATAITSTAVFDPITSMDPADHTRLVYTWSDEAKSKIFKFGDDRSSYRGCVRESYHGPLSWANQGGAAVYYTDPYGNVVNGGLLKQEVSTVNTGANTGFIDKFGALIMEYKDGVGLSQYKYHRSACVPGLGIKN